MVGFQRGTDVAHLGLDLQVDLTDLAGQALHVRVVRLVGGQAVLVLGAQLCALLAQALDQRAGHHLRQPQAIAGAGLLPDGFGLDPLLLGRGQGTVELAQVLRRQRRRAFAHRHQLLLRSKRHQGFFRVFQPCLELGQAFFQVLAGVGRCLETALQVAGDEGLGPGVAEPCGQGRIGGINVQVDQARVAHRGHGHRFEQAVDQGAFALQLGQRLAVFLCALGQGGHLLGVDRVRGELGVLDHAQGQAAAFQQLVLGLVEITVGHRFHWRHPFDVDHVQGVALDLDAAAGAVDRGGEQGAGQGQQHDRRGDAEHQPAPVHQDVPVFAQVDLVAVLRLTRAVAGFGGAAHR